MKLALIMLSLLFSTMVGAQNTQLKQLFDNTKWTDGDCFYVAELKGDFVNMSGGNLHEGGYAFGLKCTDVNATKITFELKPGYWSYEYDPYNSLSFDEGTEVVVRQIEEHTYLIVNNSQGEAAYCLRQMDKAENLHQIIVNTIRHAYEGSYIVSKSFSTEIKEGSLCTITPQHMTLGSYVDGTYDLKEEFDYPQNIYGFENGRCIKLYFTGSSDNLRGGISIYDCIYNQENDVYESNHLLAVLERKPGTQCRWPETATQVLLPGQINTYPRPVLRLIRNEIFARHGYIFNNKQLNQYFSAESWYEQGQDPNHNNSIQLTTTELLNVNLIRSIENNKKMWFPEFDDEALKSK